MRPRCLDAFFTSARLVRVDAQDSPVYNTPVARMQTSAGAGLTDATKVELPLDGVMDSYIMGSLPEERMAASKHPHAQILRDLAAFLLSVSGESVSMVKRSAPEQALKLKPKDEWRIYLEFLKVLFNLADRCSALYLPLREQPQFMDGLEDAVAGQLKAVMEPVLGGGSDPMEIVVTIGNVAAESRQLYEGFKFVVTEDNKDKDACLAALGTRVADAMGAPGNGMVASSAVLCTTAAIPAMKSMFEGLTAAGSPAVSPAPPGPAEAVRAGRSEAPTTVIGNEIKLISLMASIQGEEVETRWGLHPQFRRDLTPDEHKRVTKLMNRVTQIIAERYAAVAFTERWAAWHNPGHA